MWISRNPAADTWSPRLRHDGMDSLSPTELDALLADLQDALEDPDRRDEAARLLDLMRESLDTSSSGEYEP